VMRIATPLERVPSVAAEGIREMNGETPGRSLLDCLVAAASPTSAPLLPAVAIRHASIRRANDLLDTIRLSGAAIFDKRLRMIGSLSNEEETVRLWVVNGVEQHMLTVDVPGGGDASVRLTGLRAQLAPLVGTADVLEMRVALTAKAAVLENDSGLDLKRVADVHRLERTLDRQVERIARRSIARVQREYGADVYGFDETFMRSFPSRWPRLSQSWPARFAGMRLHVICRIAVLTTGINGAPLGIGDQARIGVSGT
ncbi:MAG: Ger(x)C family spore germination C-terminal domain-containing protein, partial [Firmicutes bacterium]|nr:Ger(x)C family spore germination C-terminal domain-containing protein [Bacillota bacterium]